MQATHGSVTALAGNMVDDAVRSYLQDALSLLVDIAPDRGLGGFHERLDWQGRPIDPGFKRVRVTGRQIYVFCQAALGGVPGAAAVAEAGAEFLIRNAIRADGQFVSLLRADGAVLDAKADLYDIAFGLFGLAWWYKLSGDPRALSLAEASLRALHQTMRSPTGIGFVAREGGDLAHEQNPHMHLFEAAVFLAAFTGSSAFKELADELFALASTTLFDPETGTLAEFFDSIWRRTPADGAIRIEPGHHFEWVWLLARYRAIGGDAAASVVADRLFGFAHAHGHDPRTGLLLDVVDPAGSPIETDLRIWPNTELLKAQVAMQEAGSEGAGRESVAMDRTAALVLDRFLSPAASGAAADLRTGLWIDYLRADGVTPKSDHVPASTMYHIMFGFSEFLRHRAGHDAFSGLPW